MIYLDSAATSYYRPREVAQAVYDAILTMEMQAEEAIHPV
mgnify:CR=1 FL=1